MLENIALKHQLNYIRNELEERKKQMDRLLGHVETEMTANKTVSEQEM